MDLIRGRESLFGKYAATSTREKPARIRWDGLVSGKSWPCHGILYLELDCVAALPSAVGEDILDFDAKPRIVDNCQVLAPTRRTADKISL